MWDTSCVHQTRVVRVAFITNSQQLWLGKEFGLSPTDAVSEAKAMSAVLGCEEFRNKVFYRVFFPVLQTAGEQRAAKAASLRAEVGPFGWSRACARRVVESGSVCSL